MVSFQENDIIMMERSIIKKKLSYSNFSIILTLNADSDDDDILTGAFI
jgi:hypothetical protein